MKLFLIFLVLISTMSFASERAEVLIVRGKVTKLVPGALSSKVVKKGDKLREDTSVVTNEKSFVKIKFSDGSLMNLGPKSMVVINKMPKKKANMVNLLTGMIKAEVKKKKEKSKTKMLVRTRSAVMGVRGTKFQTSYNHANKRTTLVTVEGKVAMARNIKKENIQPKPSSTQVKPITAEPESLDELEKMFNEESEEIVEVKEGEFSGVAESIDKPTEPVKIAPEQYNALAKTMGSKKKAKDVMKPTSKQDAQAKVNSKTGQIKPRSGGYVDFVTGLYVAPTKDAKFDKSTGTFKAKKIGSVNPKTAEYIPPKGIKVDAKKGFVVDKKAIASVASSEEKEELQQTLRALNQDVEKQVTTIEQIENKKKVAKKSKPWGPKKHILSVNLRPYSESMKVENKSSGDDETLFSESANWTILSWKHIWNKTWSTRMRIGWQSYEVKEDGFELREYDYQDKEEDDGFFSIGFAKNINKKWDFSADLVKRNEVLLVPETGGNNAIRRDNEEFDYIDLGATYKAFKFGRFSTLLKGTLSLGMEKDAAGLSDSRLDTTSSAISFEGSTYYAWKKNLGIDGGLFYRRAKIENDDLSYTKNELGLIANFVYLP